MMSVLLVISFLMLAGYVAVEVAVYLRARRKGQTGFYSLVRLCTRSGIASVVGALTWLWLKWDHYEPIIGDPSQLVRWGLIIILVLLAVDVTGLVLNYRNEQRRRQAAFLAEMESLVNASEPRKPGL